MGEFYNITIVLKRDGKPDAIAFEGKVDKKAAESLLQFRMGLSSRSTTNLFTELEKIQDKEIKSLGYVPEVMTIGKVR